VIPALAERGIVESGEQPVAATPPVGRPAAAPAPGTVRVEARGVVRQPPGPPAAVEAPPLGREPPDVHVHIDRVVVTRAPAPPPAPPPAADPPRTTVDHEAYLARRHGRR
jgi:hypothetical protein